MVLSIFILVVQLWAQLVLALPLFVSDLEHCKVWPVSSSLVGIDKLDDNLEEARSKLVSRSFASARQLLYYEATTG